MHSRHRFKMAALLLSIFLLASMASASVGRGVQVDHQTLWDSLTQLWNQVTALWQPAQLDEGCTVDPDGRLRCTPASLADTGCTADPNGRCHS